MMRGNIQFLCLAAVLLQARYVHSKRDEPSNTTMATTAASLGEVTFQRGELVLNVPGLGIRMCTGMSVRTIAMANQYVRLTAAERMSDYSDLKFHSMPDGAAVFPMNDGGYVYVSNSEMKKELGGVYGLYFDGEGYVRDYKKLLSGTTRNCGGGRTPWKTWISCEEYDKGQCWQVDPKNRRPPQITKLGGTEGGAYESVAVDNRITHQPIFYVSEDDENGALRRYTPPILISNVTGAAIVNWETLTADGGTTEYLAFLDANRFEWTTDEQAARESQLQYYPNVEGIHYHDRHLLFVSKKLSGLFVLDLDSGTYMAYATQNGILPGGGDWNDKHDGILDRGEYLYFTEDGGRTVGVYAVNINTGERYAIFEAYDDVYKGDETTGLAFSPDGRRMYAAFQDCGCEDSEGGLDYNCGCLFEFSRTDGYSFDGSTPSLKFHSPER